jgi:hypothetical protein
MKIKKFNDNEQFSYNDIMKVAELKEEVDKLKKELKYNLKELNEPLINFIKLNPELLEDIDMIEDIDQDAKIWSIRKIDHTSEYYKHFNISKDKTLEVIFWPNAGENYDDDDLESAWLSKEDIENLVEFLKNPNMYKDAKQYNL